MLGVALVHRRCDRPVGRHPKVCFLAPRLGMVKETQGMPCARQGRVVRTDPQSHINHPIMRDLRHDAEPVSPKQLALVARSVTVQIDV